MEAATATVERGERPPEMTEKGHRAGGRCPCAGDGGGGGCGSAPPAGCLSRRCDGGVGRTRRGPARRRARCRVARPRSRSRRAGDRRSPARGRGRLRHPPPRKLRRCFRRSLRRTGAPRRTACCSTWASARCSSTLGVAGSASRPTGPLDMRMDPDGAARRGDDRQHLVRGRSCQDPRRPMARSRAPAPSPAPSCVRGRSRRPPIWPVS